MAKFEPRSAGMRELGSSRGVQQACLDAARAGQVYAESISPVGATGTYSRGFNVRPATVTVAGRYGGRRAGAVLENTDPEALHVEWTNRDHVLARTAAWIEQRYGG